MRKCKIDILFTFSLKTRGQIVYKINRQNILIVTFNMKKTNIY